MKRIKYIFILAVLVLTVLTIKDSLFTQPVLAQSTWPIFRHDPQRTNRSPAAIIPPLEDKGVLATGNIGNYNFTDVGYVMAQGNIYYYNDSPSGHGKLTCVDQVTGNKKWEIDSFYPVASLVAADLLYVGYFYSHPIIIEAHDLNDGSLKWQFTKDGWYLSSIVAAEGKVFASIHGLSYPDSHPMAYALDASSGNELWETALQGWGFSSVPTYSNGRVYINTGITTSSGTNILGAIHALDAGNGQIIWKDDQYNTTPQPFTPVIDGDRLYVMELAFQSGTASGERIIALNATTGEKIWESLIEGFLTGYAISNDSFYAATVPMGGFGAKLYAINSINGGKLWEQAVQDNLYPQELVASGGNAIYAFFNSIPIGQPESYAKIAALNVTSGETIWSVQLIGQSLIAPPVIISSDGLYFLTYSTNQNQRSLRRFAPIEGTQDTSARHLGPFNANTNPSGFASEPVNTATGNYIFSRTDLAIPGRGIPFLFQRTYNSQDSYNGPLGAGWTHSYNIILKENADGSVAVKWGDGHSDFFDPHPDGSYTPRYGGIFYTLEKKPDGTFNLKRKEQSAYAFNVNGRLMSITDKNGNAMAFSYDGSGNLSTIVDTVGRTVILTYGVNNQLTQLTDPIGRTVRYAYDVDGDLASVTNTGGGVMNFSYDASHRILEIKDEGGNRLLANTYDDAGRVATQSNGQGFVTTFSYSTPQAGDTSITDPLGNKTVHTHDAQLRLVEVTDANGNKIKYTYDANNNRTSIVDQNGKQTLFSYDDRGNMTMITNPLGNSNSFTYDNRNNPTSATSPRGFITTFNYDSIGNLTKIQDALGNETNFLYNSLGLLIQKMDTRGNSTRYAYDNQGNLNKVTDALGGTTTLAYDGIGRLIKLTDPNGHVAGSVYDANSRLTQIVDPLGNKTSFAYDAVGNLLKITDAKGNITLYEFDAVNNLTTVSDALGHITGYAYDANNNRTNFTNGNGHSNSYTFDALNRLIRITDPLGNMTSYVYDPVGNVTSAIDANGTTNVFGYDSNNRLVQISHGDGSSVAYSYDASGNRLTMIDSRGTTTYSYDSLNRIIKIVHPEGTVGYGYDGVGNRTSLTYPDGRIITNNYDALNRLSRVTDWNGRGTTYDYDPASNLLRVRYPNQTAISYVYDDANRLLEVKHRRGSRLLARFTYKLDELGNRVGLEKEGTAVEHPSTKLTYVYDALSQLVAVEEGQLKNRTEYTYDAVGNRLQRTLSRHWRPKGWVPLKTVKYTYDTADRLLKAGNMNFTYDANGNRLTKSILKFPIESYTYDSANRLVQVLQGSNKVTYVYDGDGNKVGQSIQGAICRRDSDAQTFNFLNDVASPLPVVLREDGPEQAISYAYGLSLMAEEIAPIGHKKSSPDTFFYHHDGLGSTVAMSDERGCVEATYEYDAWGDLLYGDGHVQNRYLFTGEEQDAMTGLYYLRARWYDPSVGRFLTKDPNLGSSIRPLTLNRFLYTLNNPIRFVDPTGFTNQDSDLGPKQSNISLITLSTDYNNSMSTPSVIIPAAITLDPAQAWWYKLSSLAHTEQIEELLRTPIIGAPDPRLAAFTIGKTIGFLTIDTRLDKDTWTNLRKPLRWIQGLLP